MCHMDGLNIAKEDLPLPKPFNKAWKSISKVIESTPETSTHTPGALGEQNPLCAPFIYQGFHKAHSEMVFLAHPLHEYIITTYARDRCFSCTCRIHTV